LKRHTLLLMLVVTLCAQNATSADKIVYPDHIGLYTQADGGGKAQISTSVPHEQVTIYLVLIKPSCPFGVSHWECSLHFMRHNLTAPLAVLAAGTDLETADPWDFSVEIGTQNPLTAAEAVPLMTISGYVDDPNGDPTYFYIDGSSVDSYGLSVPCYAAGNDAAEWHSLTQSSRAKWLPVFAINGTVTANEATTWGALKNLFR
jgi:hypothetical protein